MTPSWAAACVAALVAGSMGGPGCATGADPASGDRSPITYKQPPEKKDGTGTVPGCVGVPERGECDGQTATSCDLARQAVSRVDCGAMGRACVVDVGRGAICGELDPDGFDFEGACVDGTAIWRDPDTDGLRQWQCAEDGLACELDVCADGAFCCEGSGQAPPDGAHCGGLDFAGICDGEVARWCADGVIHQLDCNANGSRCELDACADGAYCCDGGSAGTESCVGLGFVGECEGNVARWCDGEEAYELDCTEQGQTCRVDACAQGAFCC